MLSVESAGLGIRGTTNTVRRQTTAEVDALRVRSRKLHERVDHLLIDKMTSTATVARWLCTAAENELVAATHLTL